MVEHRSERPIIVLIVEDQPLLMLSLTDFVEEAGCEVVEAPSVDEALRILEHRTDIRTVLTDLDMRGSTAGMKLALSIRDRWPPIELLLISSRPWDDEKLPHRGVLFGKPFDRRKIVDQLRRFAA